MFLVNWEKCLLTSNSIFMNVSLIGKSFSFQILGQISDFSHLSFFLIAIFMLTIFGQHFIKTFSLLSFFFRFLFTIFQATVVVRKLSFYFPHFEKIVIASKHFPLFFLLYLVLSQFSEHWLVLFQYISSDDYLWLFALFKVFLFRKYSFPIPPLVCWFVGLFKF